MSGARYTTEGSVAVLTLDNPPVNGLGHRLRSEILAGLDAARADSTVKAIVLVGAGKVFSGGADVRELGTASATDEPTLGTVIRAVEASPKPVIAAIHGVAMGGGLELALSCHHRIADAGAQIALPEVKLGLVPGGGGTQRLPRAVGVETALEMITSGEARRARQLEGTALFDAVIQGDLRRGAIALAEKVIAEDRPLELVRDRPVAPPETERFFEVARAAVRAASGDLPAPLACVEAVAAAVSMPFDAGLRRERELFTQLVQTPESKALRHVFFAARSASRIPDVPEDTPTRTLRTAAVIGAGTMGGGIAMVFADAGIPVIVLEAKAEALEKGMSGIRRSYEGSLKKGKLTSAQLEERLGLIRPTLSHAEVGEADLVIEAVFEDLGVKKRVFEELDAAMKPGAILATNTSTLDVNRIAAFTRRPQDVVGMHFFSPANVMKLVEVVRGAATAKDVLATVLGLSKTLRKTAVVSGVCDGFIGNRMLEQYRRQAMLLLEEGALPQEVDGALERWGMAMGPFRVSDLVGNDVSWLIRKRRYAERPDTPRARIADRLCELGRFGQKTGAGWYRYAPGKRDPIPDPVVEELIAATSGELGLERRKISDDETVERCILALVNEGARILEEGIAARASDIDLVYVTGYGFAPHRGGPMFYAETLGLRNVVRVMERFARNGHPDSRFWSPAPLMTRLAAEGKSFH